MCIVSLPKYGLDTPHWTKFTCTPSGASCTHYFRGGTKDVRMEGGLQGGLHFCVTIFQTPESGAIVIIPNSMSMHRLSKHTSLINEAH
jgi:hypothetical protein